jgi:hypothetical protein
MNKNYETENCMTCKYWEPCQFVKSSTGKFSIQTGGYCHRHAPQASHEIVPVDVPECKVIDIVWPFMWAPFMMATNWFFYRWAGQTFLRGNPVQIIFDPIF